MSEVHISSSAVKIWCMTCSGEIVVPGTMMWSPAGVHHVGCAPPGYHAAPSAADEIERLRAALSRAGAVEAENLRLRAALAGSEKACVYCQLPAEEFAKCKAGFPGCARMDDLTGCPEFGAAQQLEEANDRASRAEAERDEADGLIREAMETMAENGLSLGVRQQTILRMALLISKRAAGISSAPDKETDDGV